MKEEVPFKEEIKDWIKKLNGIKQGEVDLSSDEDLCIAIMNLISIEEHLYFTAMKTNNERYLEMLNSVRELRKTLLKKIVRNPAGEEWCISKHLLSASMRLMEVGTKKLSKGEKEEANIFFNNAFDLYSLFFGINLNLIKSSEIKDKTKESSESKGMMAKLSVIIKKIVDCCKE